MTSIDRGHPLPDLYPPSAGGPPAPDDSDLTLIGLAIALLRHRRLIALTALGVFALVVLVTITRARSYSTDLAFLPKARGAAAPGLAGIAAQLGVSVPTGDAGQSPAFYMDLVQSREILGAVAAASYDLGNGRRGPLAAAFGYTDPDTARRRATTILKLRGAIQPSVATRTGLVTVRVRTHSPDLSLQIARQLLVALDEFNLKTRRSQAAAERRFTEERLGEVRSDLRAAEDRLESFLARNRDFRSDVTLAFQQERLSREVGLRQQVYAALSQAYEQARIEEVRDTPVLTVVDPPAKPASPDPRGLGSRGIAALFIGLVIGALLALLREYLSRRGRHGGDEVAEFRALRRQTLRELRKPWQLLTPGAAAPAQE